MGEKLILYHGSSNEYITPTYGLGHDKHDYGRGFYLTDNLDLASEWSVCGPIDKNGWVHKFILDIGELNILDFEQLDVLSWLAELMKHHDADNSRRYKMLSKQFIAKYQVSTDGYDVIRGWRADASYFYIAKCFVRDEIDLDILPELLRLGDLGIQYCLKTKKAFQAINEDFSSLRKIEYKKINPLYNQRDEFARNAMHNLINSDRNKIQNVFSTLI